MFLLCFHKLNGGYNFLRWCEYLKPNDSNSNVLRFYNAVITCCEYKLTQASENHLISCALLLRTALLFKSCLVLTNAAGTIQPFPCLLPCAFWEVRSHPLVGSGGPASCIFPRGTAASVELQSKRSHMLLFSFQSQ